MGMNQLRYYTYAADDMRVWLHYEDLEDCIEELSEMDPRVMGRTADIYEAVPGNEIAVAESVDVLG